MTGRPCYMSGTRIRSARGDVAVETIQAGDEIVVLRDGRDVLESVKWVGRSTVDLSRHRHVEDAAPVRIRQGALAEQQPSRDLLVSPEHCMLIDGYCVPAKLLVNGGSIVMERDHAPFTYYHVELDRHGILVAEDAPSESYLDTGNRSLFDNGGTTRQLHPAFTLNADADKWQTAAAAPLPDDTTVARIWRDLAARSEAMGYKLPAVRTVADANLYVLADGKAIQPIVSGTSQVTFTIPAGTSSVSLESRFCIPADRMIAEHRDTRRLGVRVEWMSVKSDNQERIIPADHPSLVDGWHDSERAEQAVWRWTDGSASIPWEKQAVSQILTIQCSPVDAYPVYDEHVRLVA